MKKKVLESEVALFQTRSRRCSICVPEFVCVSSRSDHRTHFTGHQIVAGLSQEADDCRLRCSKRTRCGTGNRYRRTTASKRPHHVRHCFQKSPRPMLPKLRARGADIASLASQIASVDSELTATSP